MDDSIIEDQPQIASDPINKDRPQMPSDQHVLNDMADEYNSINAKQSEVPSDSANVNKVVPMTSMADQYNSINAEQSEVPSDSANVNKVVPMTSMADQYNSINAEQSEMQSGSANVNEAVPIKRKPQIEWIHRHSFTMDKEEWESIHVARKLTTAKYVSSFIKIINSFEDMPCVLRSNGYHMARNKFVIRLDCVHPECSRLYRVVQIEENNFVVDDNGTQYNHVTKRTRQVRGLEREEARQKLLTQYPTSYKKKTEGDMDVNLFNLGNLQDIKSLNTLKVIRHEAIESFDYDKDDIFDMLKMKILADVTETDVYIQRITLAPFAITCFSKIAFEALRKVAKLPDEITMFFDATGGVVRHGDQRIYYYAGVTDVNILNEDSSKVLPLIQFVNGKHDSLNIQIPLGEYKTSFHKLFPNDQWPIKYAVTDFSFASLNGICHAWNRMDLIEYINMVYHGLVSKKDICRICTFLQLCIGHLSKTFAKDVDLYFPELPSSKQAVLQEVFAGMSNCSDLNDLKDTWTRLSTVLLSKYVTDEVREALTSLAVKMVTPYVKDESVEIPEEDRVPENEKQKENGDSIYKTSMFYQYFKAATFKERFNENVDVQNSFYSIEFADVMLKKYFSIACLWTCLTQQSRKANTYVEGHFKTTKESIIRNALTIGTPPLKCGRFLRLLLEELKNTVHQISYEIPSERLCGYKHKTNRKPQTLKNPSLLSMYGEIKSQLRSQDKTEIGTSSKHHDQSQSEIQISSDPDVPKIDDPYVEESWSRRSQSKHSFFKQRTLKKICTETPTQLAKILEQEPTKENKKRNRKTTMQNLLISKPDIYLAAEMDIAVACTTNLILKQSTYKLLQSKTSLSNTLVNYIFAVFHKDNNHVQFEALKGENIISDEKDTRSIFNIKKETLIGSIVKDEQFSLIIIDCKRKTFYYVDPSSLHPSESARYFNNFLKFVEGHNKKFKSKIPDSGWSSLSFDHQLQFEIYDSGIFMLNFANQFLTSSTISAEFDPEEYRMELQHLVLRKSVFMKNRCVICGYKIPPNYKAIDWVKCESCDRWTHIPCANVNMGGVSEPTAKYFCFICRASANIVDDSPVADPDDLEDVDKLDIDNIDTDELSDVDRQTPL